MGGSSGWQYSRRRLIQGWPEDYYATDNGKIRAKSSLDTPYTLDQIQDAQQYIEQLTINQTSNK